MRNVQKIILARPRGFCAGVDRAVRVVLECLDIFGAPVYVKHQIVHNTIVVHDLEKRGAITVESLGDIPEGSVVVFSAHGSPPEHYEEARRRNLRVIDATCPLVTKVHLEAKRYIKSGYAVVYIGHKGHIEGEGVRAEAKKHNKNIPIISSVSEAESLEGSFEKFAYLTQTTLSITETKDIIQVLRKRFPHIESPPIRDICYATTNRQEAVRALSQRVDVVLVVGSKNSSNSNRLVEEARLSGIPSYLVEDLDEVKKLSLKGVKVIGITAGASAPESAVRSIVEDFVSRGAIEEYFEAVRESMHFAEPLELQKMLEKKQKTRIDFS